MPAGLSCRLGPLVIFRRRLGLAVRPAEPGDAAAGPVLGAPWLSSEDAGLVSSGGLVPVGPDLPVVLSVLSLICRVVPPTLAGSEAQGMVPRQSLIACRPLFGLALDNGKNFTGRAVALLQSFCNSGGGSLSEA